MTDFKHIEEQVEILHEAKRVMWSHTQSQNNRLWRTMTKLLAVARAAEIYRKHMKGEIEPVQACGMDLDKALDDLQADD